MTSTYQPGPNLSDLPLFRDYTTSRLAARTGYSEAYLLKVRAGYRPLTPQFKSRCARMLRCSEAELFNLPTPGSFLL